MNLQRNSNPQHELMAPTCMKTENIGPTHTAAFCMMHQQQNIGLTSQPALWHFIVQKLQATKKHKEA